MSLRLGSMAIALGLASFATTSTARAGFVVFETSASTPAGITATRDAFRAAIGGGDVAGANGSFGGVRREINWDGMPDARADPNLLPENFFNVNSPRGVVFSTPGTGFLVSSNPGLATPPHFGFSDDFVPFSNNRLFSSIGSNVFDVDFFVAGTTTDGGTQAFGAVFNDVETADTTKLELFDIDGNLLISRFVQTSASGGLSFLGFQADAGEVIARVRFTLGDSALLGNGNYGPGSDGVVVDDFLYGETFAIPEPASLALFGVGGLALAVLARRHRV